MTRAVLTPSVTLALFADDIAEGSVSFSVAWGRNNSAREDFRPYKSDEEAKRYRDDYATMMRRFGCEVRCSTLRGQTREWWSWQVPCNITCAVYKVEILSVPDITAPAARAVLAPDLFTRPYADLDDVQARIGAAVAFIADRTAGKAVPEALDAEITFARATLDDLAAIKGPKRRAAAFREEHGIETMKGLWFAIADHGPLLGLSVGTSAEAAR